MALNNKLAQKRLLIIGGSSGIGLATAQQATAAGAQTIVAGRSESKLRDAVASISGDVTAYPVDLTDDASVKSLFEKVGALDYLVLTGPAPTFGHFLKLDTEQVHQEFEGKFWGQYRAVKYAAPRLEKTGAIVLMSGAYSARPVPGATSLAAVQAGIEGLARGLAIDLAPIRVNVISPGLTDTPIIHNVFSDETARKALYDEQARVLPAQRVGTSEDIAESILYLLTNRYTTGSTLFPDGGYSLR
ncbi:MAG: SDR family oxidoreductase [Synechococcales cyanobacterium CRU_2_2]|nr:SDR family oxidoreductase [Synechococcales cyanobacterium CRU_2_2]